MNFNTIPVDLRTPGAFVEFDNSRATTGLSSQTQRVLIIAQRLATGAVTAGVPVQVTNLATAQAAWAKGSMIAAMCEAFLGRYEYAELWGVAVDDDGTGVKAAGSFTVTGPATAAGTLALYIAKKKVSVGVASAATAAQIATSIAAAINADTSLPVTAAVDAAVTTQVNVTARHKGEVGNSIDLRANYNQGDRLPAGVGITIVAMTGGTGNPDIGTALAAIGAVQYTTICTPYVDAENLALLETELAERWDGMHTNDGHCITASAGSHATLATLGNSRNSPHVTIMGTQQSPSWTPIVAALVAAAEASESHPLRPRQALALTGMGAPSVADRYTRQERNLHLYDGIATYTIDDFGACAIERLVTTYKQNEVGADDESYLDIEILRGLSYIRYQVRQRLLLVYPRHMLGDDGGDYAPGLAIATPSGIRAELVGLGKDLERAGIIEDLQDWIDGLLVERPEDDRNRVNIRLTPNLINQLRITATSVQYRV